MMDEVFLRRLSRWQAETQREALADLYAQTHAGGPGAGVRDGGGPGRAYGEGEAARARFLRRFAADVRRPGFDMVIAGAEERLTGCAYGFTADRFSGWWQELTGTLPPEVAELRSAGGLFVVSEMMVRPAERRFGIATRLRELLLLRAPSPWSVALVPTGDDTAAATYRAWGWSLLEGVRVDGTEDRGDAELWAGRRARPAG